MARPRPKYSLIADQLWRDIQAGRYPVGRLLPTECKMMHAYGVSRHTIRNALAVLKSRGVVSSRQGQGYLVVAESESSVFAEEIQSFDELIAHGQTTRRIPLGTSIIEADKDFAAALRCAVGRQFVEIRMLRQTLEANPRTIALVTLWMDVLFESAAEDFGEQQKSAAEIIRDRFGYETRSVHQTIWAELLSQEHAANLGAVPGCPALVIQRAYCATSVPDATTPFLVARSICRADKFRVESRFSRPN